MNFFLKLLCPFHKACRKKNIKPPVYLDTIEDKGGVYLVHLKGALVQSWNIAPPTEERPSRDDLRNGLALRVAFLLKHDYQRLVSAMYLLDIPEEGFEGATAGKDIAKAAEDLAEIIFEREIEKLESRKRYRRERSIDVPFSAGDDAQLEGP